ncbi:putative sulfate exporter family transporter [Candidatus Bathyarchaeota archaeon]|nr:putative sulfate exporter family transporter [Candidatus Bathyarchaeota archaeon]
MEIKANLKALISSEDWWACWLGFTFFITSFLDYIKIVPKPKIWFLNPLESLSIEIVKTYLIIIIIFIIFYSLSLKIIGQNPFSFIPAFLTLSALGFLSQILSQQNIMNSYGLEYVVWALTIGLLIGNTFGIPRFLTPAVKTELYIKTGLVLLGSEILFSRILALGIQGLLLAWGVTPIVLYISYKYGTSILKIDKTLAVLIASATSVCGVSAAIAVAAATKAKKESLTLTISISLIFTEIMLVGLPAIIKALNINYIVGGAWIGGTVDSTGAVVAAGELLSKQAMEVATVIKLIQNVMIGVITFVIAIIWTTKIDQSSSNKPNLLEIWYRFPKFIIAFVVLSLISSFVILPIIGESNLNNLLKINGGMRTILFSIAFLGIGLESDFRSISRQITGGKTLNLYIISQLLNIILTFIFAWLLFS